MPWNNQGGGGWQNGGGNRGPWGQPPSGGGGQQPPDLEDIIRQGQDRLRSVFGGFGGGSGNARSGWLLAGLLVLGVLAYSSIYRVDTTEQGIILRFGEQVGAPVEPGLHVKLPWPVETVLKPSVTVVNRVDIGAGDLESLMLTGDENIVDIDCSVFWRINDAGNYLFNVQRPDLAVKLVAESAMREVVGQSPIQVLLTTGRAEVQQKVQTLMQTTLDFYGAGIQVMEVQLQEVGPPNAVVDAFRDVQAARADQERARNVAERYANTVIPKARGDAEQILQAANAYREQTVAEAQGETQRFTSIYDEYKVAQDVTRKRMFLETMEKVFKKSSKIVIDPSVAGNVVPYLPLNELQSRSVEGGQ